MTSQLRIAVTGATGLLGPWLVDELSKIGSVSALGLSRGHAVDLSDRERTRAVVGDLAPDIVVHAMALADVDACERRPEDAARLNEAATRNVVEACGAAARFVYISTDQVYGDVAGPHTEDVVAPVNVYGASKLAGERAALAHPNSLVLRTNMFGPSRSPHRSSLSDTMAAAFREGRAITLFEDSLFSPLHLATLATLVAELARGELTGVFNLASRQGFSKADFGVALARHLGLSTSAAVRGSSVAPGRVRRARDLRMDPTRLERALQREMPTLQQEITKL